mgnify:CR=1 FL=1|tara:strand:+ start:908 stop:1675 length:768 start_codon:yes stop_codon:yes gene_type:complete
MDKRYQNLLTAVFLVAGRGTRILEYTDKPKCLLKLKNKTLIESNIEKLVKIGISNFIIVLGYKKELIIEHLNKISTLKKIKIKYVDNKNFISKGNSHSLLLGLNNVKNKFCFFLDGDIFLGDTILKKFINNPKKNLALIGKGSLNDKECAKVFIDKDEKIKLMIDKIFAPKKVLNKFTFLGEAIGIIKLNNNYKNRLIRILQKFLLKKKNYKKNWEKPLNEFLINNNLDYEYTRSNKWIEIDDKNDYLKAKRCFK